VLVAPDTLRLSMLDLRDSMLSLLVPSMFRLAIDGTSTLLLLEPRFRRGGGKVGGGGERVWLARFEADAVLLGGGGGFGSLDSLGTGSCKGVEDVSIEVRLLLIELGLRIGGGGGILDGWEVVPEFASGTVVLC